jgi:hypothetical protein
MKKTFLAALVAATLFASASVQAVEVTTNLAATTKVVTRGVLEAKDGSVSAEVRATQGAFFGDVVAQTLQDRSNIESVATLGFATKVYGVDVTTGYDHRFYTGNGSAKNAKNFGEVFTKVNYNGLNALVAQTVSPSSTTSHDTYTRVGYTTPKFFGFTGDVGTAYTHFRNVGVTRHTNTEASVSYDVLKNVKVAAGYSFGGKNVAGVKLANQSTLTASIGF